MKIYHRFVIAICLLMFLTVGCAAPGPHWWAVTASSDNTARVWDAMTGKTIAILQGHTGPILSAVFSPDGKWVATASADKTAHVWDAATGQTIAILSGHEATVRSAIFSSDGKWIVTGAGDATARVWEA